MSRKSYETLDLTKLGASKKGSAGEIRYNCPYCEPIDTDFHLYVNLSKNVWYCQRCSSGGSFKEHAPTFANSDVDLQKSFDIAFVNVPFNEALPETVLHFTEYDEVVYYVNLPHTCRLLKSGDIGYKYLINRGYTKEDILHWNVMVDMGAKLPRLVFPDYRNNRPVFWVTRKYVTGDSSPKYLNGGFKWKCSDCGKISPSCVYFPDNCSICGGKLVNLNSEARARGYVFGLFRLIESDAFKKSPVVVVTEGPSSCMMTPINPVATLGKGITEKQLEVLLSLRVEVCFALDNDALKEVIKYVAAILSGDESLVSIIPMSKGEDPGDVGKDGMIEKFCNRIHIRSSEDLLDVALGYI